MSIPSVLFNAASLDVVVAARPDLVASPPPPTTLANLGDADLAGRTDAWVEALLKAPRRAALYHDERLHFHLVVALPSPAPSPSSSSPSTSVHPAPPALTRHQAATLLLDSLPTTPHLQIAADLAYVDPTAAPRPPPLPARTSSLHGPGAGLARAPLTPASYPAHAAASTPTRESHAGANEVHIGRAHPLTGGEARVWVARGRNEGEWVGVWLLECALPYVRTQLRDPRLAITVAVTLLDDPKLALLLDRAKDGGVAARGAAGEDALEVGLDEADDDEEYMEDSYDDVNLLSALAPISSHALHLPFSRLSSFSPQPPPSLPVPRSRAVSISHTRTLSASSSTSSSSGDPSNRAAHAHHPSLRRSVRRVLPLRPAVHIDLRAVPCPVGALGLADGQGVFAQHGAGVRGGGGAGDDDEERGLVLCVEVRGAATRAQSGAGGEDAQDEAFEVDSVELVVEGAAPPRSVAPSHALPSSATVHDLEVRRVTRPTSTSSATSTSAPTERTSLHLRLAAGSPAQHNFVYALARIPGAPAGTLAAAGAGVGEAGAATSVPRAVALSPALALQGGGRFGGPGTGAVPDEEEEDEVGEGGARGQRRVSGGGAAGRSALERNVTVIVTGRPVVRRRRRAMRDNGYDVPDDAGEAGDVGLEREEGVDRDEAATAPFACRWHTALDISPLARPASRPHRTAFAIQLAPAAHPAAIRPTSIGAALPFLPPAHAAGRLPLRPSPATNVQVESVAGSKRHTMSSLAALSQRSPVLNRKNAGFAPPPSARPSSAASSTARALPPTPGAPPAPAPTPSLVGSAAPKRFISLPPGSAEPGSSASAASSTPHIATPVRTETPSPMHGGGGASGIGSAVAAAAKRVSLPSSMSGSATAARLDARPKDTRRTSWMSGLVPGGGSSGGSGAPSPQPPSGSERTSWPPAPPSSTLGLGLDDTGLEPQDDGVVEQPRRLPAPPPPQQQHSVGNLLISVSLVPLRAAKSRRAPFAGIGGDAASTGPSSASTAAAAAATGRTNAHLPPAVLPGLAISRAPSPSPAAGPTSNAAEPHATPRFAFPASQPPSGSPSPSASPLPSPPLFQVYDGEAALRAQAERSTRATSRMPRVNLLDVFLVEVFLFNHSDQVKRFTVGVGSAASRPSAAADLAGAEAGARRSRDEDDERVARLVPLENDVRIGPLAPNSCASVGIRFLAIRPGAHVVEALRIVDLADGSETMLERPLWVVVE
ncbi:hypothetical protein JCM9279_002368 [Rhodotorula babjevae]